MTKFGLEALIGKAFNCLFDLNLSMKRVKKVFVYKCKLTVLRNTLLPDMFINKVKTKFNSSFLTKWRTYRVPSRF